MVSALASFLFVSSAQVSPKATKDRGYIAAKIATPFGGVTVYLTNDMVAGDTVTGAVFADNSSSELKNLRIDIGGNQGIQVPKTKFYQWHLPQATANQLLMTVISQDGAFYGTSRVPISPTSSPVDAFTFPNFVQIGRPAVVYGPFDGDATTTKLSLGDSMASVLAESPRSAVIYVPYNTKPGATKTFLEKGKAQAGTEIRAIGVQLSCPKTNMKQGEQTSVSVDVQGLTGLNEVTVPFIRIENLTPDTLDMGGQAIHHIIPKASKEGTYHQEFKATSKITGSFLITTFVEPGPGIPILPKIRDEN